MTKEEILEQLKHDRDLYNFNPMTGEETPISEDCRKSAEALDMIIKMVEQQSDDYVSRHTVDELCFKFLIKALINEDNIAFYEHSQDLPPVQSKHGTCKDCKNSNYANNRRVCRLIDFWKVDDDFYCANWKRRKE